MFKKIVIAVLIFLSFLSLSAKLGDLRCSEAVPDSLFGECKRKVKNIEEQWKNWAKKQCPNESKVCTTDKYVTKKENDELKTENNKLKEAAKSGDTEAKLINEFVTKQKELNKNLEAQLEAKEKENGKLKSDIRRFQQAGDSCRSSESNEAGLKTEIENLKDQIAEKNATIASKNAEIERLKEQVSDVRPEKKSDLSLLVQVLMLICLIFMSIVLIKIKLNLDDD
ncbi:hypothetical protein J6Y50_01820 [bacterium]|nr:hypothetical protein [bacterium]